MTCRVFRRVVVHLDLDTADQLDQIAEQHNTTVSSLLASLARSVANGEPNDRELQPATAKTTSDPMNRQRLPRQESHHDQHPTEHHHDAHRQMPHLGATLIQRRVTTGIQHVTADPPTEPGSREHGHPPMPHTRGWLTTVALRWATRRHRRRLGHHATALSCLDTPWGVTPKGSSKDRRGSAVRAPYGSGTSDHPRREAT